MKTRLGQTPFQTVGPYFAICLGGEGQNVLRGPDVQGEPIRIEGRVLDGDRRPIEDALIELWQAHASGRYRHPADTRALPLDHGFTGFGRAGTDFKTGGYWFETIRPGCVPDATGAPQAPHLSLVVQARGMLLPAYTRVYFPDCAEQNARDAVLSSVPAARRSTLVAKLVSDTPKVFSFDICFQGDDETVFFDF